MFSWESDQECFQCLETISMSTASRLNLVWGSRGGLCGYWMQHTFGEDWIEDKHRQNWSNKYVIIGRCSRLTQTGLLDCKLVLTPNGIHRDRISKCLRMVLVLWSCHDAVRQSLLYQTPIDRDVAHKIRRYTPSLYGRFSQGKRMPRCHHFPTILRKHYCLQLIS